MGNDTALLVVDVQVGFIEGDPPVYQAAEMLARIKGLVGKARAAHMPVIYVQHNTDPDIDGPIHPGIAPAEGDMVVLKYTPDSFHETALKQALDARGIRKLVLVGFQTEYCIDTTCRRAWSLGYDVTLVKDAHSTFTFEDAALTAPQIIAHHTGVLAEFATIKAADEVEF